MDETTRHSLIERLRDTSDEESWREFASLYLTAIYRIAVARGLQHADATDVVQEVVVEVADVVNEWQPGQGRGSWRRFLRQVTRKHVVRLLREAERFPAAGSDTVSGALKGAVGAATLSGTFDFELARNVYQTAAAIVEDRCSPETWEAFVRTTFEDEPISSVARGLGVRASQVRIARHRILQRLRAIVAELLPVESDQ